MGGDHLLALLQGDLETGMVVPLISACMTAPVSWPEPTDAYWRGRGAGVVSDFRQYQSAGLALWRA